MSIVPLTTLATGVSLYSTVIANCAVTSSAQHILGGFLVRFPWESACESQEEDGHCRSFMGSLTKFVGKLVGRYYDSQGNPTKYLKGVEAKAARGSQLLEKQKVEEAKIPGCNSKWSQSEGGMVWCDEGYPRLIQRPLEIALTGKMGRRCACFKKEELDQPHLELYKDCDFFSMSCKLD